MTIFINISLWLKRTTDAQRSHHLSPYVSSAILKIPWLRPGHDTRCFNSCQTHGSVHTIGCSLKIPEEALLFLSARILLFLDFSLSSKKLFSLRTIPQSQLGKHIFFPSGTFPWEIPSICQSQVDLLQQLLFLLSSRFYVLLQSVFIQILLLNMSPQ